MKLRRPTILTPEMKKTTAIWAYEKHFEGVDKVQFVSVELRKIYDDIKRLKKDVEMDDEFQLTKAEESTLRDLISCEEFSIDIAPQLILKLIAIHDEYEKYAQPGYWAE